MPIAKTIAYIAAIDPSAYRIKVILNFYSTGEVLPEQFPIEATNCGTVLVVNRGFGGSFSRHPHGIFSIDKYITFSLTQEFKLLKCLIVGEMLSNR